MSRLNTDQLSKIPYKSHLDNWLKILVILSDG